jgi:hypothetical protein
LRPSPVAATTVRTIHRILSIMPVRGIQRLRLLGDELTEDVCCGLDEACPERDVRPRGFGQRHREPQSKLPV